MWTEHKTLRLIDLYRQNENLWDPKHPKYYNKMQKGIAWDDVGSRLGESADDCKRKMVTLLSSMRRERMKIRNSLKLTTNPEDVYEPTWFAYNSLQFIWKDKCGNCMDESHIPTKRHKLSKEEHEEDLNYDDTINDFAGSPLSEHSEPENDGKTEDPLPTPMNQPKTEPTCTEIDTITKKQSDENRLLGRSSGSSAIWEEECRTFGDYIASKLKTYDKTTRSAVQHAVSNIIFNADIGRFEQGYNAASPEKYY